LTCGSDTPQSNPFTSFLKDNAETWRPKDLIMEKTLYSNKYKHEEKHTYQRNVLYKKIMNLILKIYSSDFIEGFCRKCRGFYKCSIRAPSVTQQITKHSNPTKHVFICSMSPFIWIFKALILFVIWATSLTKRSQR
jgi:hypothetical protein